MRSIQILLLVVLSSVGIPTAGQQPAPSAPTGAGVIAGRVLDAMTGQPLAEAAVSVAAGTPAWPRREVQADGNGAFVIRDMPAGSFLLSLRKAGYAYSSYGERFPSDSTQWFDLEDGEQALDVTIRAWRTATVSGRVLDAAGRPVFGVTVQPRRVTPMGTGRMLVPGGRSATTDRDGAYRLTDLSAGSFVLAVPTSPTDSSVGLSGAGADQATLGYPTLYFPGVVSASRARIVALAPGDERTDVDITRPALTTFAVSGAIVGFASGDRTPLQAMLMPADAGDPASPIEIARTSIGPDGRFTFPRVPPGHYVIHAEQFPHPAAQPGTALMLQTIVSPGGFGMMGMSAQPLAPMASSPTLCASLPVTVDDRPVAGVIGGARAGGRITGQLVFDGTAPQPNGAGLNHAAIVVMTEEGRSLASFQMARIEADGTFATAGLPAGKYSLMAMPLIPMRDGAATPAWGPEWALRSTSIAGRPSTTGIVELGAADLPDVTITLSDHGIELSGVVRDADGTARPDASVYVFPTDRQAWTTGGLSSRVLEVRPARSGTYRLTRGMPGEYYVVATLDARPDWRDRASLEAFAKSAVTVQLVAGTKKVLDLRTMK